MLAINSPIRQLIADSLLQDEKNEMLHTNTWLTYVSTVCQFVNFDFHEELVYYN